MGRLSNAVTRVSIIFPQEKKINKKRVKIENLETYKQETRLRARRGEVY